MKYKCVERGKDYRIFQNTFLGIFVSYTLEDSRNTTHKGGTEFNVKLTDYYFKTLEQVRKKLHA
tara:strand:- start:321 stop:512 length:192 start_codon:yes stop_codon:yes gene_type:complete